MRVRGAEGEQWRAAWLAVFLAGWVNIRGCSCSIGYRVVAVHLHLPRLSDGHNHRTAPQSARYQITHTVFHVIEPAEEEDDDDERRKKKKRNSSSPLLLSFCLLFFSPDIVYDLQVHHQPFSPTNATCQFIRSLSRSRPGFQQPIQARYHSPIISYPTSPCISCVHCSRPNPGVQ